MELGHRGGADHVFPGGVFHPVGYVVVNGGAEQENVLLNDPHVVAKGFQGELPNVLAVDGDAPFRNVVEPGQQVDDGALAAARSAQDGGYLARLGRDAEVLQRGHPRLVGERHIFEFHASLRPLQYRGVRLLHHGRLGIQHLEEPATRRDGSGEGVDDER